MACTDVYPNLNDCLAACEDSTTNAALGGPQCFSATQAPFTCIGSLGCAQLETLGTPAVACATEDNDVALACG